MYLFGHIKTKHVKNLPASILNLYGVFLLY